MNSASKHTSGYSSIQLHTQRRFFPIPVIVVCMVFLLLPICKATADTSVWKVSKGDSRIYLGGTLHILSKSNYPLPAEFDKAYDASDLVVFETDIAALSNPDTMQQMNKKMVFADGSTIHDHLSPKTISAIEAHLVLRGISLNQFETLKPSMLSVTLTLIELQILGIDAQGVDAYYSQKAVADNKEQLKLETVEEQFNFIVNMGADDPDKMLEYTLLDIANLETTMDKLVNAWREGNPEGLNDQLVEVLATDYPTIYRDLVVNRNTNWLPQLVQYFESDEIEFVMVGAAHLVGEFGLLKLLEADGYTIEQL